MKSAVEWYIIERVKERRKKLKMSQQYLADCLNVSQSFIKNVESPKECQAYNIDHLNEIAKVFGCSMKDLIPEQPL